MSSAPVPAKNRRKRARPSPHTERPRRRAASRSAEASKKPKRSSRLRHKEQHALVIAASKHAEEVRQQKVETEEEYERLKAEAVLGKLASVLQERRSAAVAQVHDLLRHTPQFCSVPLVAKACLDFVVVGPDPKKNSGVGVDIDQPARHVAARRARKEDVIELSDSGEEDEEDGDVVMVSSSSSSAAAAAAAVEAVDNDVGASTDPKYPGGHVGLQPHELEACAVLMSQLVAALRGGFGEEFRDVLWAEVDKPTMTCKDGELNAHLNLRLVQLLNILLHDPSVDEEADREYIERLELEDIDAFLTLDGSQSSSQADNDAEEHQTFSSSQRKRKLEEAVGPGVRGRSLRQPHNVRIACDLVVSVLDLHLATMMRQQTNISQDREVAFFGHLWGEFVRLVRRCFILAAHNAVHLSRISAVVVWRLFGPGPDDEDSNSRNNRIERLFRSFFEHHHSDPMALMYVEDAHQRFQLACQYGLVAMPSQHHSAVWVPLQPHLSEGDVQEAIARLHTFARGCHRASRKEKLPSSQRWALMRVLEVIRSTLVEFPFFTQLNRQVIDASWRDLDIESKGIIKG